MGVICCEIDFVIREGLAGGEMGKKIPLRKGHSDMNKLLTIDSATFHMFVRTFRHFSYVIHILPKASMTMHDKQFSINYY